MKRSAGAKKSAKGKASPWGLLAMSQGKLHELGCRLATGAVSPVVHRVILWQRPKAVVLCRPCLSGVGALHEALVEIGLQSAPGFKGLRYGVARCGRCRRVHVLVAAP